MKRWTAGLTAAILAAALLLGGCTETPAGSSGVESAGTTSITETEKPIDSVTYLNIDNDFFVPVSYFFSGKQWISGTIGPWGGRLESEIPGLVYDPDAVNLLKKISIKNAFVDDSEIPTYRSYNHKTVMNTIATNGNWNLFPIKIRYEKYTLENQPNRQEWVDYFRDKLNEVSPNIPLVFTEAWFFDWTGNGEQSVIVNVGNLFEKTNHADFIKSCDIMSESASLSLEKSAFYQISTMFTYTEDAVISYDFLSNIQLVSETNDIYIPCDEMGSKFSGYYTVQYDNEGKLIACPIGHLHLGIDWLQMEAFNQAYLLSDIDGDEKVELIATRLSRHGLNFHVFRSDNGRPNEIAVVGNNT